MTILPRTYFLGLQWMGIVTLFAVSIFIHRPLALATFGTLLAWKVYTGWLLPRRLRKSLAGERIHQSRLRQQLKNSPLGVKTAKTKLLKLQAPWPSAIVLKDKSPYILISDSLLCKMNSEDCQILLAWSCEMLKNDLPTFGLKFYSYTRPFLGLAGWLDRIRPKPWCEPFVYKTLLLLFYPLTTAAQRVQIDLETQFSKFELERFRKKLATLIQSHGSTPPTPMGFLLLDSQLPMTSPLIHQNKPKGLSYGSQSNFGS